MNNNNYNGVTQPASSKNLLGKKGVKTKDETLSAQHTCDQCAFEAQKTF